MKCFVNCNCLDRIILIKSPTGLFSCNSPASRLKRERGVSRLSLITGYPGCLRKRLGMKILQVLSTFLLAKVCCFFLIYGKMERGLYSERHVLICSDDGFVPPPPICEVVSQCC